MWQPEAENHTGYVQLTMPKEAFQADLPVALLGQLLYIASRPHDALYKAGYLQGAGNIYESNLFGMFMNGNIANRLFS